MIEFSSRTSQRCYAFGVDVIRKLHCGVHVRVSSIHASRKKSGPGCTGAARENEALRLALVLLLDHSLAATAVFDDDLLLHATLVMMTPAIMMAAVAMLDDDRLADVAVAHSIVITMMTVAFADLHLHVLRGRRSRKRWHRKRQSGNSSSRESKFSHVLLLEAGFPPADTQ